MLLEFVIFQLFDLIVGLISPSQMVAAVDPGEYLLTFTVSTVWNVPFIIGCTVFVLPMGKLDVVKTKKHVMDHRSEGSNFLPVLPA